MKALYVSRTGSVLAALASCALFFACSQGATEEPTTPAPDPMHRSEAAEAPASEVVLPPPEPPDQVSTACAAYDKQLAEAFVPYIEAFSNLGVELSPDGKQLLFLSDRGGGSFQLYIAPVKGAMAEPTPIAPSKDRVRAALFTPEGSHVMFLRDSDNDENYQIYRAKADGSDVTNLTNDPGRFHTPPFTTPSSDTLYFFRGVHTSTTYELVALPVKGGSLRPVTSFEGFHFLSDISPDGAKALAVNFISLSESRLLSIDLSNGEHEVIAPTKGAKAHASYGVYSADGESVYVVTDEGQERAYLKHINVETGESKASYASKEAAEINDVVVSKRGALAVGLDRGSHQLVEILDAKTLKRRAKVKLPLGRVSLGRRFSTDGKTIVATASTPTTPNDIYRVDTRGKASILRPEKREGLDGLGKVKASVERVDTFDDFDVPINVYRPVIQKAGERQPVVVVVHGGPAGSSSIRWNPINAYFISRGFTVVEPNVRGSTGFGKAFEQADNGRKRMDALRDLDAVNGWIREQSWADPERLVVFGGSYGGYMTYMALGHQPEKWRAGIGLVGVVNLKTFLNTTTGAIRMAFRDEFGRLEEEGDFLDSISPIQVIDQFKAPLFVYQGQNDPRVPRSEQDQLVRALRKRGLTVEYMVAPDEGHSLSHRPNKLEFVGRTNRFLDLVLERPGVPEGCTL